MRRVVGTRVMRPCGGSRRSSSHVVVWAVRHSWEPCALRTEVCTARGMVSLIPTPTPSLANRGWRMSRIHNAKCRQKRTPHNDHAACAQAGVHRHRNPTIIPNATLEPIHSTLVCGCAAPRVCSVRLRTFTRRERATTSTHRPTPTPPPMSQRVVTNNTSNPLHCAQPIKQYAVHLPVGLNH